LPDGCMMIRAICLPLVIVFSLLWQSRHPFWDTGL